jgi:hypothetical protein
MIATLLLALMTTAAAEDAWTTQAVELTRWPTEVGDAANPKIVDLVEGVRVEIVFRKADQIRVRKGGDFGWLPPEAITTESPLPVIDGK